MDEYDFFLSFRGDDSGLADRIHTILTTAAPGHIPYRVFYQPHIYLGEHIVGRLTAALQSSTKVLVVFTPNYYLYSRYTQMEFDIAWETGKLLIFRFEGAELPPNAWQQNYQEFDETDPLFDEHVRQAARLQPIRRERTTQRISGLTSNMPGWKGQTSYDLIGRDEELQTLTEAFHNLRCSIVCVIADGGYGKSSLVSRWLEDIRDQPSAGAYLGIQAAYAYSFYKQGWETGSGVSTKDFFESTLAHFRGIDIDTVRATIPERDRPSQILDFLNDRRSLLVLDGLEPNQAPQGTSSAGEIEDQPLREFVKAIAMRSGGLCIITSRIMPRELTGAAEASGRVCVIRLGLLSKTASARALMAGGVARDHPDLEFWVGESKGHPLLLALFAPIIRSGQYQPQEFVSHRLLTKNEKQSIPETIRKVVWARLDRLGPQARAVLLCTCLFEKPTEFEVIRTSLVDRAAVDLVTMPLLKQSLLLKLSLRFRIAGVLNYLGFLRPGWSVKNVTVGKELLVEAAMLVRVPGDDPRLWKLETHPVIQAGIRDELSQNKRALWRQANWTVYRSFLKSAKPMWPDDPNELSKIYAAVPHGVNAGKGLRAGWTYAIRCLRGYRAYSTNNHGMIADDVSILSHYFEGHWQVLKEDIGLNDYAKVQAYVWSGALLTGVNRWKDGKLLMEQGVALAKERRFFSAAARTATHLGVGYAIAGEFAAAEFWIRDAIEMLQKPQPLAVRLVEVLLVNHDFQRMQASATLGSVLHYQGKFADAEKAFQDATLVLQRATKYRTLRAMWCFRQVELMLDRGNFDDADWLIEEAMIDPTKPKGWGEGIFCVPLLQLASVRSHIRRFDMTGESHHSEKASTYAKAFADFGEAQSLKMDWLVPVFKIALSGVARLAGRIDEARVRIDEADKWARRSGNRLFEADVRTEQARVHLAADERLDALQRIVQAETLSIEIGYHCRLAEISHLRNLCG